MKRVSTGQVAVWLLLLLILATPQGTAHAAYRLAILGDRTGGHEPGVYPSIIEEIELLKPDIVVTVGDQIEGYGDDMEAMSAEWDTLLGMLDAIEAPVYLTAGNHDIWCDDSEALYRNRTGFDPYYSFDFEQTHFVILDNSRYESWNEIDDAQLDWLREDLGRHGPDGQVFVFYHKPLWLLTTAAGVSDPVHELLVEHGVDAVFTGHFHHYFHGTYDGIRYTSVGSSGGYMERMETEPVARGEFFQFAWVTVREDGLDLAVIDAGNVYPLDFHTVDNQREITAIESEYVAVTPLRLDEGATDTLDVVVRIENGASVPLEDVVRWSAPGLWAVEPASRPVSLEPGEAREFEFRMCPPESIFPAPSLSVNYPLSNGMEVLAEVPLRVMRRAEAALFGSAPAIDGALTEPCWLAAQPVTRLYPAYDEDECDIDGDTEFRFGHDDENLYLSAVCHEPAIDAIVAESVERDGPVYRDDCVGFFIQPDTDEMTVYQVYASPEGTVFDQRITYDESMIYTADVSWDGDFEAASRIGEDRWVFEAAIPLSELGVALGESDVWRINFRRKQQRTFGVEDWQVPLDYHPNTLGELVLR